MRLVTAEEMKTIDWKASEEFRIPSLLLMENAGRAVARVVERDFSGIKKIAILSGKGNNGGDGFVAARHLANSKSVTVLLAADPKELKGDAAIQFQTLSGFPIEIEYLNESNWEKPVKQLKNYDLLIDALFGTGLTGNLSSFYRKLIETINMIKPRTLAVDIPSGLEADSGKVLGACLKADFTITMGLPKRGLLAPDAAELVGQLEIADIGYPPPLLQDPGIQGNLLDQEMLREVLPKRKRNSHKGTYGKVLVIAGSLRYRGAANLTSLAALRVGAGLVELALPESLCLKNRQKADEIIQLPLRETSEHSISSQAVKEALKEASLSDVVIIGPGLGLNPDTIRFVRKFLLENPTLTIFDADGLNALAGESELLLKAPAPLILTPHPAELARLLQQSTAYIQQDRLNAARIASRDFDCIVVLKGYHSVIADPEGNFFVNPTGNPAMATAGMGDVLAGTIGGILAQKPSLLKGTCLSVYIHGLAGDLAAQEIGERGLIASDLIPRLPRALYSLS